MNKTGQTRIPKYTQLIQKNTGEEKKRTDGTNGQKLQA